MIYKLSYFKEDAEGEGELIEKDVPRSERNASSMADESSRLAAYLTSQLQTEQFSSISHEFKTPINIILSSLDLLKLKLHSENPQNYDETYAQYMYYMEQNCYKLLRLVINLLDRTKM